MPLFKTGRIVWAMVLCLTLLAVPVYGAYASAGVPIVSSIYVTTPGVTASVNNGTTTTVTVTGANLTGVTGVTFYQGTNLDPLISIDKLTPNPVTPDTKFKVDIIVDPASVAGPRNVTVTTPSGVSAMLNAALIIDHATVFLSMPASASPGNTFWVAINVNNVDNLNASQFELNFDSSKVQVTGDENTIGVTDGVTNGRIPSTLPADNYPQAGWTWQPTPGTPSGIIKVLGHVNGVSTVTGSGYLAMVNFTVLGSVGTNSNITVSGLGMYNGNTSNIAPDSITDGSISIVGLNIVNSSLPDGTAGASYAAAMAAAAGTPPYSWTQSGLPVGLNLNSTTGAISGNTSVSGTFNVSFNVTDSAAPPAVISKTLSLKIYPALQVTTPALPEGTQGKTYPSTALAASGGKIPYTWNATGLPSGLSLNATSGIISGTPTVSGNFSVNLSVTDSFSPPNVNSTSLTLRVYAPVQITTAVLPPGVQGIAYNAPVAGSGGKTPYTWSATGLPSGLSIGASTGIISGSPTVTGNFSVNITLADAMSPANTTNVILSLSVGTGVAISTTTLPEGTQNVAYPSTQIIAAGGQTPYSWSATGLPAGLTIGPGSGIISGTPTVSGNFSVAITVNDSSIPMTTQTATLSLHIYPALAITTSQLPRWAVEVYPVNPPASWIIPPPGWIMGQAYTANVTATGGKGIYTWSASGLPSGLLFNTSTGMISGTPTVSGNFSVTVSVIDVLFPANPVMKTFLLKIYKPGDANGDNNVNVGDVTFEERILLGLEAPTAGCDANANGLASIGDVTRTERIILGLS